VYKMKNVFLTPSSTVVCFHLKILYLHVSVSVCPVSVSYSFYYILIDFCVEVNILKVPEELLSFCFISQLVFPFCLCSTLPNNVKGKMSDKIHWCSEVKVLCQLHILYVVIRT
jgi:hypothetical protein